MELINKIKKLMKSHVSIIINERIKQFESMRNRGENELFKELAFCILTANYAAEPSIRIQEKIGDGFITLTKEQLRDKLKALGHRFPNKRAEYIVEARKHIGELNKVYNMNGSDARMWLVENVKGIGMKEASHFLRNIGFKDVAIIDFHIIDLLEKGGLIKRPKTLTKNQYLKIENLLKNISKALNTTLAQLDLYMWYLETGKVLK